MNNHSYKLNSQFVTYEVLEGEAVVVNLLSGIYYSLDNEQTYVWERLMENFSPEAIAYALSNRFSHPFNEIAPLVDAFASELEKENLIYKSFETSEPEVKLLPSDFAPKNLMPLQKFTEMKELLQLDPIHEVDEQGWPYPMPLSESACR
ncbi:PqqD family protein [Criblamydia sequanensis]|uniref:PqqD family protein n=1 Tax=Candidatus Criblamydia sequanensis CRIB-18 TaxID=1437425 RepID=A0A090CZF3_9BACT|nr:PqqD family protein [Criblamydia sequanensis]CDR34457.1 hypothetical protein CSEC_1644 [Criblamydia sequanensis CRIB-18]